MVSSLICRAQGIMASRIARPESVRPTMTLRRSSGSGDSSTRSRALSRSTMPRMVAWSTAVALTNSVCELGPWSRRAQRVTNWMEVSCGSQAFCWKIAVCRW
ncbi:hypothetical protein D3C77_687210 [compost metagenome]